MKKKDYTWQIIGLIILFAVGYFIYDFIYGFKEEGLEEVNREVLSYSYDNQGVDKYLKYGFSVNRQIDENFDEVPVTKKDGYKFVFFEISSNGEGTFLELNDQEQMKFLLDVVEVAKKEVKTVGTDFYCGKNYICIIDSVRLSITGDKNKMYRIKDLDLQNKGKEPTEYVMEVSDVYGTEIVRYHSPGSEMVANLDKPSDFEFKVHRYMQEKYRKITSIQDYEPEKHDLWVANMASTEFNITAEKAGQIYVDVEMYNNELATQ